MDEIKEESDEDYLSCVNSCFLCLEAIPQNINNSEELINSTNLFFNYLKIRDEIQTFVCANCGENLTKFVKLCSALEKVRLEMDYLLDSIKSAILDSNKSKPVYYGFVAARQLILWKRLEDVMNPKPEIILERMDTSEFKEEGGPIPTSDCSDEYLPNCDVNSTSSGVSDAGGDNKKPDIQQRTYLSKRRRRQAPAYDFSKPTNCDDTPTINEIEDSCTSSTPRSKKTRKKSEGNTPKSEKTSEAKQKKDQVSEEAKCPKCSKTFTTKVYLKIHNDTVHLGLKPFSCPKCPKMFGAKQKMKRHVEMVHLHLKPYKCDMCEQTFVDGGSLRSHKTIVHLRLRPFKCPTCLKTFGRKTILTCHINDVHLQVRRYMCDVCGRSFKSSRVLQVHKAIPHVPKPQIQLPLTLPCNKCKKMFSSVRSLNKHERNVHPKDRFKCDICTKSFGWPADLKRHISAVHEKQRYHCQVSGCNKNCSQKSALIAHYRVDHPDSSFVPKPPKIANYLGKMENGEIVFECNICTNKFKTEEAVRYHIRSIHDEKTFLCADCGFSAPYESRLKKHVERMHKVDKSVECQV